MNIQKTKSLIKEKLPVGLKDFLLRSYRKRILNKVYGLDKKYFLNNSYFFKKNRYSKENLRARITFHYHAIEKGLSHTDIRYNFGKKAYTQLFYCMDKFIELGYDCSDTRFQQAISVIGEYINLHKENDIGVDFVENKYNEYKELEIEKKAKGGYTEFNNSEIPKYDDLSYSNMMLNRHSIRDYGLDDIEKEKVFQAIEIAIKSPSACNRQPWKVYYVKDESIINILLDIQGGLRGNGKNIRGLLIITSDKSYYGGPHERNQNYIDGGIFLASLIYALTSKQIASCPLHADLLSSQTKRVKSLLSISEGEDLISFIAIGSFPEFGKYANSPRDSYSDITTLI